MFDRNRIPAELQALTRWVGWRYEERNGQKTKVPYNARTLETASSTNPAHWTTLDAVLKNAKFFRGPGLIIASPYVGIDLDQARDPHTGVIEQWAQLIITELNSFTEISPSGRGFHIWVRGELQVRGRKRKMVNQLVTPEAGKTPALECYASGRYFTMSSQRLDVLWSVGGLRNSVSPHVEARNIPAWAFSHFGEITEAELSEATYTPADPDGDNDPSASGEEFRVACAVVRDLGIGATRDQLCAEFLKRAKPRAKLKRKDYVVRTIINAQAAVKLHRGKYVDPYGDLF